MINKTNCDWCKELLSEKYSVVRIRKHNITVKHLIVHEHCFDIIAERVKNRNMKSILSIEPIH